MLLSQLKDLDEIDIQISQHLEKLTKLYEERSRIFRAEPKERPIFGYARPRKHLDLVRTPSVDNQHRELFHRFQP